MVSEQIDMLDEEDAKPSWYPHGGVAIEIERKIRLVREIAENGEAIIELDTGETVEFHGHDAHFYAGRGVIMTEHDGKETWIFGENIVNVGRH